MSLAAVRSVPLWTPTPDRIASAPLRAFMAEASRRAGRNLTAYANLHRWSVEDRGAFWDLVWDFGGVVGEKGERLLADGDRMPGASFFPDARLNYAENLLRHRGASDAIVFKGEDKVVRRLSWDDLRALVSRLQQLFVSLGVKRGDRVAAMMPNMPEAVAGLLAASSIGAVWSSCSPDFGEQGVLDRFGQIEPVVLLAPDGYWYAGKQIDVSSKLQTVLAKLPSVRKAIIVDYLGDGAPAGDGHAQRILARRCAGAVRGEGCGLSSACPFNQPLYILFFLGHDRRPEMHRAWRRRLAAAAHQGAAAARRRAPEGDRLFYFTTCGWMMWNWLVSGLASELTLLLCSTARLLHPPEHAVRLCAGREDSTCSAPRRSIIDSLRKSKA
jgi:acetoacetyl-CoA synthetase